VRATVLIPTHDHGPTLRYSVAAALAQTVKDIEVFIVGDGMREAARDVARSVAMLALLEHCDFGNALPLYLDRRQSLGSFTVDLEHDYFRRLILSGTNRIPLSCAAHMLDMYRKLPHGWRTRPAGIPTDLDMWQQFLADPRCRARSAARPTVLCFPASTRKTMTAVERADELAEWSARIAGPPLTMQALERFVRDCARIETQDTAGLRNELDGLNRSVEMRAGRNLCRFRLSGPWRGSHTGFEIAPHRAERSGRPVRLGQDRSIRRPVEPQLRVVPPAPQLVRPVPVAVDRVNIQRVRRKIECVRHAVRDENRRETLPFHIDHRAEVMCR
jgi:hypothetical protein